MLLLDIVVKKLFNRFAFSNKLVTSLLFTGSGGINEILLPFTNIFNIVQYVLGAILGSLNLFARRLWCFDLEEPIAFHLSSIRAYKSV